MLKFFDADPNPGSRIFLNLSPGSVIEKIRIRDPGSGINSPDPQHTAFFHKINPLQYCTEEGKYTAKTKFKKYEDTSILRKVTT
jgi:hypothetical protein